MAQLKDSLITGDLRVTGTIYGKATNAVLADEATAVRDKGNGTLTYLNYGAAGMSTTSWIGSWDGYTLKAISPANLKTTMALNNVENTKLSTWAGSSNITTIGTLSSGTVPWARLSNVPSASTSAAGIIQIGTGASNAAAGNHNHDAAYVNVTGDSMSGRLTMTSGKPINQILTGSGTAGGTADAGANADPRYTFTPSKWTFNTGLTATNGDIFVIKIPAAGHSHGVYMSVNNGTNYYPVVQQSTSRITTHYGNGYIIAVIFDSAGSAASMVALNGATGNTTTAPTSTVSGGVFRVINYYDSNTTYSAMSVAEMKTGTATSSRVMRADHLKTFLSTLGGTALTLTHDATNGLVLNHDNYVTAGTAGTSSATSGITLAVPYITYNAQGHITATGTHTHTIPDASTSAKGVIQIGTGAGNAAAGNHNHDSVYVNVSGDTMTGKLTVGTTSQSAAPTASITVHDTRNYTWTPTSLDKGVNWYFTKSGSPNTSFWWAIQNVHGWTGDYNAWELAGPCDNSDQRTTPLYVRTGRTTNGWGSWRKIYDTSNKPSVDNHSYTPAGSVSVSTNGTTNKTAPVSPASSGTVTYTPAGTIAVNTAGSTVDADDITAWTTNTPTAVTKKTVVTGTSATTISVSSEVLTIPASVITSATTGDSVSVTAGTAASLSYTARTVKSGDASYKFTGTGVRLVTGNIAVPNTYTASFTGTAATLTHTVS